MKTKKIRKRFELADYLEEEKFLQVQHKKGWRMVDLKLGFSTYIFEECEPDDYAYQLDFKEQEKDLEEYLQLFEDCGWEHFYKFGSWYYFRKKKSEIPEENVIFNDAPTRAEMAKKVVRFQGMISFIALFPLFYIVPILLNRGEKRCSACFIINLWCDNGCFDWESVKKFLEAQSDHQERRADIKSQDRYLFAPAVSSCLKTKTKLIIGFVSVFLYFRVRLLKIVLRQNQSSNQHHY